MAKSLPGFTRLPLAMVIALTFDIGGGGLAPDEHLPNITVTAPSAIAFGMFLYGDNTMASATAGSVKVTGGSARTRWQVSARNQKTSGQTNTSYGQTKGYMLNGSTKLSSKMAISKNETPPVYADADEWIIYTGTGTTGSLPFRVKQTVTDAETTGTYSITIVFTGSIIDH